jgi:bifunctional N-acetylglucosamine-1-phosphate-uridyltransferase/glucosamine-1-phosphate-acetyltransferase GlmU-like protein
MRVIHKRTLIPMDIQTLSKSESGKFLTIQMQNQEPVLWYETDPDEEQILFQILCVGTGHAVPVAEKGVSLVSRHIATTIDPPFVWHWYQRIALVP